MLSFLVLLLAGGCAPGVNPFGKDAARQPAGSPAVKPADRAVGGIPLEAILSGEIPVESMPADVVARLGVWIGFDPEKLKQNVDALAKIEVDKARNDARVSAERAKAEAAADFYATVRRFTGWAMGVILAASVAALIAGFIPAVSFVTRGDGLKGLGIVGAICILRYTLLTYGKLAGDIAGWILIAGTVVGGAWVIYAGATIAWRARLLRTSDKLAREGNDARAAAALEIAARGIGNDPAARKFVLFEKGGLDALELNADDVLGQVSGAPVANGAVRG